MNNPMSNGQVNLTVRHDYRSNGYMDGKSVNYVLADQFLPLIQATTF